MPSNSHLITRNAPTDFRQAANSVTSRSKGRASIKWITISGSLLLLLGGCAVKGPPPTAWPAETPQLTIEQKKEVGAPFYLEDPDGNVIRDIKDRPLLAGYFTEPKGSIISKEPMALFYKEPVIKENLIFAKPLPGLISITNFKKVLDRMYKEYIAAKKRAADLIKQEQEKEAKEYDKFQDCMRREITITALTGGIIDAAKCQGSFEVRTYKAETLEAEKPRQQKKKQQKHEATPQ